MLDSVRPVEPGDRDEWMRMRTEFWPVDDPAEHERDTERFFLDRSEDFSVFVAEREGGGLLGFAEVALRRDYVAGCRTSPVGYLEGIWVDPDGRRGGVAGGLFDAALAWVRERGCTEMGSDAEPDNFASITWHESAGFERANVVVCFRRDV